MKRFSVPRMIVAGALVAVGVTAAVGANPVKRVAEALPVGIGMATTQINCLPWSWFWLENQKPEQIARGDMVQFHASGIEPVVEDGTRLIKIVAGVPGDKFQTTQRGLFINGQWYDEIRAPEAIQTEEVQTVPPGSFLALGVTDGSFDSRFFGAVSQEEIIGTAQPLFAPGWDTDYHSNHGEELTHRFSVLLDGDGHSLGPRHRVARGSRTNTGRR